MKTAERACKYHARRIDESSCSSSIVRKNEGQLSCTYKQLRLALCLLGRIAIGALRNLNTVLISSAYYLARRTMPLV